MSDLFGDLPTQPPPRQARPAATPAARPPVARPPAAAAPAPAASWRAPSRPREEPCVVCQSAAIFGDGPNHYCYSHAPAEFFPGRR